MKRKPAMPACGPRYRSMPYLVATLTVALLYACAQLEPMPEPTEPTPAPLVSPAPPASAPEIPPPSSRDTPSAPSTGTSSAPAAGDIEPRTQERGRISMYGSKFSGRKTASGELFDPTALTMAHRTLPFGTRVRVTNLANQRSVEVVVNDRGPFVPGRVADLSQAAAHRIGMVTDGVVDALLDILQPSSRR